MPLLKLTGVPFSPLAGKGQKHLPEVSRVWQGKETPGADLLGAVTSLNWRNNPKPEETSPPAPKYPPSSKEIHLWVHRANLHAGQFTQLLRKSQVQILQPTAQAPAQLTLPLP